MNSLYECFDPQNPRWNCPNVNISVKYQCKCEIHINIARTPHHSARAILNITTCGFLYVFRICVVRKSLLLSGRGNGYSYFT